MFSFNMCIRILQGANKIDPVNWRFLLTGASKKLDAPKPEASWLTDGSWNEVQNLATLPSFGKEFVDDFVAKIARPSPLVPLGTLEYPFVLRKGY